MSFWLEFLPIVIYILLIVILIVGIILGIRFIILLGKAERVVDDINQKVKALDGIFQIIDAATDKVVVITDKVVEGISSFISKLFMKKDSTTSVTTRKKGKI